MYIRITSVSKVLIFLFLPSMTSQLQTALFSRPQANAVKHGLCTSFYQPSRCRQAVRGSCRRDSACAP